MNEHPIARAAYDRLAARYATLADQKPHNAHYDRPAVLSLLPPIAGKRAVDVGCGPGWYSEWLLDHGASQVLAIDVSPAMVMQARARLLPYGDRARVVEADMGRGLGMVEAGSQLIISGLALHYVRDWQVLFAEFHRLLEPAGHLVFSVEHPWVQWTDHGDGNYFDVERVEYIWRGFGKPIAVPSYRRPLQEVMNPLLDAGFVLEKVLEPRPTLEFRAADPRGFEELNRSPGFLCLRAQKP